MVAASILAWGCDRLGKSGSDSGNGGVDSLAFAQRVEFSAGAVLLGLAWESRWRRWRSDFLAAVVKMAGFAFLIWSTSLFFVFSFLDSILSLVSL